MRFKDKVVWITGASSGIGEALAKAFRAEGAKLILSARRETELARVKEECGGGGDVALLPLDLEQTDQVAAKAAEALGRFGQIDVLVNNAGITQRSLVKDTTLDVDERIMRLDYFGQVAITKAVLPSMLERKAGHIVVISSVAGYVGTPLRSAYAAAKHALRGFFDSLRAEVWRENVAVTMVYPGYIQTNITLHALRGDGRAFGKMGQSQEVGMPADKAARKIVSAVAKRKEEFYVGGKEVGAIYLQRFFPGLMSKVLRKAKVT